MYSPKHYTHVLLPIKTFLTRVVYEFVCRQSGITNQKMRIASVAVLRQWGQVLLVLMMRSLQPLQQR